ncbi:hypothetical protein FLL57_11515 [Rhodopseudomonas palustris]|uniref:hypothetical protein n=1 Tax=Rhodopseudomonas palustris TaxID=1076 RepID=UPI00115E1F48|nr:hypothetical protein [Rhodopseudomonas palustris]QDL97898.1 hypothetical protein FLL57_11515 [Rhodopseudomonas palustris]
MPSAALAFAADLSKPETNRFGLSRRGRFAAACKADVKKPLVDWLLRTSAAFPITDRFSA